MNRKLLVAYSMTSTHVQTTLDYLRALKAHLGYQVTYLHVTHDAQIRFDFSAEGYDIVFHNYCARFCFENFVSASYCEQLKRFNGLKVMAVQDEYDFTDRLKSAIKEYDFQIVLTCVPQRSLEYVYPRQEFPGVEFISTFTGYVPEWLAETKPNILPLAARPILVGYRGRDIGPRYGRLGFEKFEIGRRMKEICQAKGIVNDIAMDEASRIYGTAWFDFVGRCRAMLGSESGSNVFDFDGSIAADLTRMTKSLGRPPRHDEFRPIVAKRDTEIDMGQISPRVFECAVMRTPMLLFRGRYSDAIKPNVHYIPLELDFANVDDVLDQLDDLPALDAMTERTYQDLVASGRFGYHAFCTMLKERFDQHLTKLSRSCALVKHDTKAAKANVNARIEELTETPTNEPKSMEDYRSLQIRLAGIQNEVQIRQMDQIYTKAMTDCLAAITTLQSHRDTLTRRILLHPRAEEFPEAISGIQHRIDAFRQSHQMILQEKQKIESERAAIEQKISSFRARGLLDEARRNTELLATLHSKWIGKYAKSYEAFYAEYSKIVEHLQKSIDARLAILIKSKSPLGRAYYLMSTKLTIIRALVQGSKLQLAKLIVRRMPGGQIFALAALRLKRWLT